MARGGLSLTCRLDRTAPRVVQDHTLTVLVGRLAVDWRLRRGALSVGLAVPLLASLRAAGTARHWVTVDPLWALWLGGLLVVLGRVLAWAAHRRVARA